MCYAPHHTHTHTHPCRALSPPPPPTPVERSTGRTGEGLPLTHTHSLSLSLSLLRVRGGLSYPLKFSLPLSLAAEIQTASQSGGGRRSRRRTEPIDSLSLSHTHSLLRVRGGLSHPLKFCLPRSREESDDLEGPTCPPSLDAETFDHSFPIGQILSAGGPFSAAANPAEGFGATVPFDHHPATDHHPHQSGQYWASGGAGGENLTASGPRSLDAAATAVGPGLVSAVESFALGRQRKLTTSGQLVVNWWSTGECGRVLRTRSTTRGLKIDHRWSFSDPSHLNHTTTQPLNLRTNEPKHRTTESPKH